MTEVITSRHNSRVKAAAKLRDRRGRREQQRIIIDGVREIGRAIDAGVEMIEAFVCEDKLDANGQALQDRLCEVGCEIVLVNQSVLEKIAFGDRSEGIVAAATTPSAELSALEVSESMLVAVLENVEKPGNVGAILRSADSAGVSAVIVADAGTDLFNPNAIRASAGTIFSMPVAVCTSGEALAWLRQHTFRVFAARVDGASCYTGVNYQKRSAIALGSEANGLSDTWHADDITPVIIPMRGISDSLNVSVTAAVFFYEALRQRESTITEQ